MAEIEQKLQEAYCPVMIRQRAFGDYLNGRNWNVDLCDGIVKFGDDLVFPIQLLGSYSELSGTWLWSWGNPFADTWSPKILEEVKKLQNLGGIFNIPSFPLEHISGHEIAMVCSELLGRVPYYRGPYANGALFFLVQEIPVDFNAKISSMSCLNAILDAVNSRYIHNHRDLCRGCLKGQYFDLDESDEKVMRAKRGHEVIVIEFNEDGIIKNAEATL